MKELIPLFFILLIIPIPAFAQEFEEGECIIKEPIDQVFDSIEDFAQAQTNGSDWFDQEKKDQINKVTDSGTNTGKVAFELWCNFHQFMVDGIFAGSPVPFDKGIIVLVSMVVGTVLVFKLFWEFFKKIWKITLIMVAIIAIVLISGIQFPSIS